MIKKNVLNLQRLKQQKQYSNPCSKTVKNLPVYGDRVNLFEKRTNLNKINEFVLDYYNIWGNHYDL